MDHQQFILDNLKRILDVTDNSKAAELVSLVNSSGATFIGGAGRSLLVSRFFAMRLVHSGHKVFMVGEVVTPAIKEGDLLILVSGSGGTATHGVLVVAGVTGTFAPGEQITGQDSTNTANIQSNAIGFQAVRTHDFSAVKSICQAGSPTHTSDTDLTSTYGAVATLTGTISVSNSSAAVTGSGTSFTTELKVGDIISFTTDGASDLTRTVEAIISDTSLSLTSAVGGSDVTTAASCNRTRAKLTNSNKNTSIFKLPYSKVKTLKTASNSNLTDTNFTVRRQFVATLSSGATTLTAGTDETFTSLLEGDYTVSVMSGSGSAVTGDVLSLSGNNHEGNSIFTLGGSPTGKQLTLDFGSNYGSAKLKVMFTVNKSSTAANSKTKTLNENEIYGGGAFLSKKVNRPANSGLIFYNLTFDYWLNEMDNECIYQYSDDWNRVSSILSYKNGFEQFNFIK